MENAALVWIMFYIAVGIMGIFIGVVYLVSKKSSRK
jgi:hypothetical protein